jgi:tryptophan-rich sensory protein
VTGPARRSYALSLSASALAAVVGGLGSRDAAEVYGRLEKPGWAPPAGVFGPAWTVLYTAIGVAGGRLAHAADPVVPLALHGVQLALNAAWSPLFFAARRRRAALLVVAALDATVAAEIVAAVRRDRVAAALLVPYLGWTLFATALNAAVSDPAES